MPPLHLLIKPASGSCNLRCRYCFYHDLSHKRDTENYGLMSEETLESIIKKALEFADGFCSFGFQGGEPTLRRLEFFETAVKLQKKYNGKSVRIENAIQTNGMITDEKWAEFLAKNHFLVGLSLDGKKELHNLNRIDADGNETFGRVMQTVRLFDKYKVEYNILTVVTSGIAKHIRSVYAFYKKQGFEFQQYIPCLDPLGEPHGENPYSLTPEKYAFFLNELFDCWFNDIVSGNYIYNRYFENLIGILKGRYPESCAYSGMCGNQLVVEADGSVYPCDFYVTDRFRLGNINTDSIEFLLCSPVFSAFAAEAETNEECRRCKWYGLCRGGCRRDRDINGKGITLNYFCESYKAFFEKNIDRLIFLAKNMS